MFKFTFGDFNFELDSTGGVMISWIGINCNNVYLNRDEMEHLVVRYRRYHENLLAYEKIEELQREIDRLKAGLEK